MPNRLVRDGFVDSDRVNNLDYDEECFYHRLILCCDDAGRFDGRLQRLRSALFPLGYKTNSDPVIRGVDGCQREGLILVYDIDSKPFLQVTNWQMCGKSKLSKFPGPDGTFDIRYVLKETKSGQKKFLDTSIRSGEMASNPSQTLPFKRYGDGDGDGDGRSAPHGDGVAMGSASTLPSKEEMYKKHPCLQLLHDCELFKSLSLEQYLLCLRARSPHINYKKAFEEIIRRALLQVDIKKPAAFIDSQLSYWETDHRDEIHRRKEQYDRLQSEINTMVETIVELNGQDDERLTRMRKEFERMNGMDAMAQAGAKAHEILKSKKE